MTKLIVVGERTKSQIFSRLVVLTFAPVPIVANGLPRKVGNFEPLPCPNAEKSNAVIAVGVITELSHGFR